MLLFSPHTRICCPRGQDLLCWQFNIVTPDSQVISLLCEHLWNAKVLLRVHKQNKTKQKLLTLIFQILVHLHIHIHRHWVQQAGTYTMNSTLTEVIISSYEWPFLSMWLWCLNKSHQKVFLIQLMINNDVAKCIYTQKYYLSANKTGAKHIFKTDNFW